MYLAYLNAFYRRESSTGGNAHIGQFIANAVALGHEVWTRPGDQHPAAQRLPSTWIGFLKSLRCMDVIYFRLEATPPRSIRLAVAPFRQLIGSPLVVWEFNTVPEFGYVCGLSADEIRRAIDDLRRYSRGCDLAICVSDALTEYVREIIGIERLLTVPNGSDPDLFRPGVPPVKRVQRNTNKLNLVWIGSAHLGWHNFDLLHKAAKLIWERDKGSRIEFHIIGQGSPGLMRDMPPNVHFHGPEHYEALPHWLAAMDVGLCLYRSGSADYSSPLKLFDYMASGLAVIGTFQPQVRKVFDELGQLDLMVPPEDPKALASVLSDLACDRDRISRQGKAGRQLVIDFYNWRRAVRDIIREIEIIFENQKGKGTRRKKTIGKSGRV